ncbi:MAG: metallophosphoesterase [Candidatus Enterenecus sp.]
MTRTERGRRKRRVLLRLLIAAAVLAAGLLWFRWQQWGLMTTETQVELAALPEEFDGFRIVHLSDLHGHEYGEDSGELLSRVREQSPDLIVMTGDMIDQESQMEMIPALAKGLAAIAPTYYVTGNHEWALGTAAVRELKSILEQCGVTVLSNQYVLLERNGGQMVLAGVDDPNGYADQKTPGELYAGIAADCPGLFTLLLAHRNDHFDQYAAAGYDLVLSGHGHGGIVRLPFTDGLLGTSRNFFPTWTAGVYTLGDSTLFVSRGLGSNTGPIPGFRLFNRPELAVVELKATQ